ncbi:transcriptional repressor [Mucor velutinosus]|uniref:Transcriptional repressor n=1 Tax=Mucor velutinosus TaxID=708070 RepID=A0AAN7D517_9FUNG|nr:transcriptional repressor [Mucor velutinosus]
MDSALSIKNASGKTFSLLNDSPSNAAISASHGRSEETSFKVTKLTTSMTLPVQPKRKYHCVELGCNKSFTTSGHLARHNRIHTGEKNFHCLHPGCPSRFSRQDNMMQHYRTHLSQKLRRQHLRQHQQQQQQQEKKKESPQLYCHSLHGGEDHMSFQPLMTRPRRSVTMPSLPYPPATISTLMNQQQQQQQQQQHKVVNRPRRALSTSSTCSSSSVSSCSASPPSMMYYYDHAHSLPPPLRQYHAEPVHHHHHYQSHSPHYNRYHHTQIQQPQQSSDKQLEHHEWAPNSQKSLSSLLHLANIVSTFG